MKWLLSKTSNMPLPAGTPTQNWMQTLDGDRSDEDERDQIAQCPNPENSDIGDSAIATPGSVASHSMN